MNEDRKPWKSGNSSQYSEKDSPTRRSVPFVPPIVLNSRNMKLRIRRGATAISCPCICAWEVLFYLPRFAFWTNPLDCPLHSHLHASRFNYGKSLTDSSSCCSGLCSRCHSCGTSSSALATCSLEYVSRSVPSTTDMDHDIEMHL